MLENLWRKIPEIILRAAFFRQRVSQCWIRGVESSWPLWRSAFPTWVPVKRTLQWAWACCKLNQTPYPSHKISRIFFGLWQIRHYKNIGAWHTADASKNDMAFQCLIACFDLCWWRWMQSRKQSPVSNQGYNSRSLFAQPHGKYCAVLGSKESKNWNFLHWFPTSLLQVTVRNKIMSWMEQWCSSWVSNGPEQRNIFATSETTGEQMHDITAKKNQSPHFISVNSYIIWMYFTTNSLPLGIWLCATLEYSCVHTIRTAVYL